jgi:uncharacterized protein (TIGR03437 family)
MAGVLFAAGKRIMTALKLGVASDSRGLVRPFLGDPARKLKAGSMIRKTNIFPAAVLPTAVLIVAGYCSPGYAQVAPPAILEVEVENLVQYQGDISDPSKFGTNPNVTPPGPVHFSQVEVVLADIVAVNGQPAKGTFIGRPVAIGLTPAPTGQAPALSIADITRSAIREQIFEILKSDGTPVGTIVGLGLSGGPAPPGVSLFQTNNFAIVGGTGAFLGARGQFGVEQTPQTTPARAASIAEDPAKRRINGGGRNSYVLTVIAMSTPQIVTTAGGPAVTHSSDFSLVSASKPAAAGETLSVFVIGLGPTNPGVDPGKPFPASPLALVNSPVAVTVNGKSAEVTAAVGFPGAVDGYQVNFRVPQDTAKGVATIQVSAAWITGPAVNIAVQ